MTLEIGPTGSEGSTPTPGGTGGASSGIGAGAGTTPPAGPRPAEGGTTTPGTPPIAARPVAPAAPIARPERTFKQADVDAIVTDRLARERRSYQLQMQQALQTAQNSWQQELRQQLQGGQYRPPAADPLAPIREQLEDRSLDINLMRMEKKYDDFEANQNAIMEVALQAGTNDLEWAYRAWKYEGLSKNSVSLDKLTVDTLPPALRQQIIDTYVAEKKGMPRSPEGRGGSSPVTPGKKIKSFDDADEAAQRILEQAQKT